jgi:hypothetical protein
MDWGEFDKWWYKHDNTKEFGHCIRQMTDDQLYEAWEQALRLQKNESSQKRGHCWQCYLNYSVTQLQIGRTFGHDELRI